MTERESVTEAREDWEAAQRELDQDDRDPDYARLWAAVEERRQGYQRAVSTDRDDDEER